MMARGCGGCGSSSSRALHARLRRRMSVWHDHCARARALPVMFPLRLHLAMSCYQVWVVWWKNRCGTQACSVPNRGSCPHCAVRSSASRPVSLPPSLQAHKALHARAGGPPARHQRGTRRGGRAPRASGNVAPSAAADAAGKERDAQTEHASPRARAMNIIHSTNTREHAHTHGNSSTARAPRPTLPTRDDGVDDRVGLRPLRLLTHRTYQID